MKILVTGATGFAGKFLVKKLKEKGYDVYCLVRKSSVVNSIAHMGVKLTYGDITDISSLFPAVEGKDYVYHLAIARTPRDIRSYYSINCQGTENLIQACQHNNPSIKKFVYISSLAAAGFSPSGIALKETDTPHPITHYGKSKLKAEETLLRYKEKLPITILRPPTITGPENLFFNYIRLFIKHGIKPLWKGYTSLCYVDDFVDGAILAAERKEAESQTYFICDGFCYSWKEIVNTIASYIPGRKQSIFIPGALIRASVPWCIGIAAMFHKGYLANKVIELAHPYWLCNPEKIIRELNFQSRWNLKTGIAAWNDKLRTNPIDGLRNR